MALVGKTPNEVYHDLEPANDSLALSREHAGRTGRPVRRRWQVSMASEASTWI